MLDMLALGIIIPVLPKLVEQFENGNTARAAEVIGVFGTSWAVMQFLASPVLGALSDRFGRRPIILLSNLGLGLDYILMALAPTVGWLWVGRIVSGVTSASIGTAFAYVADVTRPEKRAKSYGMMGAAFGIGFIVGPALGGVLTTVSPRLPFWVSASFSLANFCYGLFILPESLPHSRRAAFSWLRANPVGSLKLLRAHPQLMRFAAIHFLYNLAHQSLATVFVLYTGYRYGWTPTDVGWALASVGVSFAIIQAGLVGRLVARFGEWRMLIAGLPRSAVSASAANRPSFISLSMNRTFVPLRRSRQTYCQFSHRPSCIAPIGGLACAIIVLPGLPSAPSGTAPCSVPASTTTYSIPAARSAPVTLSRAVVSRWSG